MKAKLFALSVVCSAALSIQPFAQAAGTSLATEQLAQIMLHTKDVPTANDKALLEEIAKDTASTNSERTLAAAILNLDKKVRQEDKQRVMKVWISPAASETERAIAKAILKFDSTIDDQNKVVLDQIASDTF